MRLYHARFYGRRTGAIGVNYWIETTTYGDDPESARLNLYDHYENLQQLTLTDVTDKSINEQNRSSVTVRGK